MCVIVLGKFRGTARIGTVVGKFLKNVKPKNKNKFA
jgi:hypothetical protein